MTTAQQTKPSGIPAWLVLVAFLVLSGAVAAIGGRFSPGPQYLQLNKPSWTPPGWLFGPVWSVLYTAMAIAAWRIWKLWAGKGPDSAQPDKPRDAIKWALLAYFVQLALNALWSPLFFGLLRFDLALVCIVAMLAAILTTIVLFWRHDRIASMLLWPYLAWVSFATVLNASIWSLNRVA